MAYPGQNWQQSHQYKQPHYGGGGYPQQQQAPQAWHPNPPGQGQYGGPGPQYAGNTGNYPGPQVRRSMFSQLLLADGCAIPGMIDPDVPLLRASTPSTTTRAMSKAAILPTEHLDRVGFSD